MGNGNVAGATCLHIFNRVRQPNHLPARLFFDYSFHWVEESLGFLWIFFFIDDSFKIWWDGDGWNVFSILSRFFRDLSGSGPRDSLTIFEDSFAIHNWHLAIGFGNQSIPKTPKLGWRIRWMAVSRFLGTRLNRSYRVRQPEHSRDSLA